ncbi:MAG: magnesium transporter CorA family protein [Alphaproteobacteria bacterium]|nr:magnesium transporter CorA family protein [Alphaproteobacteria bacterium]
MFKVCKTDANQKLIKLKKNRLYAGSWVNVINPTNEELEKISAWVKWDVDALKTSLDIDERSRIEQDGKNFMVIINLPLLDDEGQFDTLPCSMVFTSKNIVTLCSRENRILGSFTKANSGSFDTKDTTKMLLNILYKATQFYLRYLKIINRKTESIEYSLRNTTNNKELFQLMEIQKSLVYFTTALRDNQLVLQKLIRLVRAKTINSILPFSEDDIDLLEDIMIENKQAIEMVDMHRTILESMMDGFASVINNNVNQVMKFLAAITIILSIPTMLASFWGMNVDLPLKDTNFGFWYVIAISTILTVLVILFFRKKKMF